MDNPTS